MSLSFLEHPVGNGNCSRVLNNGSMLRRPCDQVHDADHRSVVHDARYWAGLTFLAKFPKHQYLQSTSPTTR